jgi:hypothetical protein
VHPYFLWFAVFVGLNLMQSAFTLWCPMMTFLRRTGACSETAKFTRLASSPTGAHQR